MKAQPTFFVGAERSGTTLFRLLLDSHPEVTCIEGLGFVADAIEPASGAAGTQSIDAAGPSNASGDIGNSQRSRWKIPSVSEYRRFLETDTVFSTAGFTIDPALETFDDVVDRFLHQRLEASGKDRVVAKLHDGFEKMLAIWPEARFIHLLRDPRAMALSGVPMEWGGNPYMSAARWVETEKEWDRVVALVPAERRMEVRFEDLVTEHEKTLARVCEFLDVDYTDQMLEYAEVTDYDVPDPSRADAWPTEMSERDIRLAEARVGDMLVARGYEPSGLPSIEVGPNDLRKMKTEARVRKWKHKLTAHGAVGIGELVTRKLGVEALHTPLKQRMNGHERSARKRSWREPGREYSYAPHKRVDGVS